MSDQHSSACQFAASAAKDITYTFAWSLDPPSELTLLEIADRLLPGATWAEISDRMIALSRNDDGRVKHYPTKAAYKYWYYSLKSKDRTDLKGVRHEEQEGPWSDDEDDLLRAYLHHTAIGGRFKKGKALTWEQIAKAMNESNKWQRISMRLYDQDSVLNHYWRYLKPYLEEAARVVGRDGPL